LNKIQTMEGQLPQWRLPFFSSAQPLLGPARYGVHARHSLRR
jgi:hypothetical protein